MSTASYRRRTLDLRYFSLFLVLICLLGVGTHFLHAYQVKRNAHALLEQADRAEADKDLAKATEYLGRYVGLEPNDIEARARFALLLDQHAKYPFAKERAFLVLDDVLRRDPENDRMNVRRRAAELAVELGRTTDARAHLERILEKAPADAEMEELLGRCEEESKQFDKARAAYESALQHAPDRVKTARLLVRLLRSLLNPASDSDKKAEASRVLDALVKANPNSLEARMLQIQYLRAIGKLADAEKNLGFVRDKMAPDDAEVLLTSGDVALADGRFDDAKKHLERGRKLYPGDMRFLLSLARLEIRGGIDHRQAAIERLHEILQVLPDEPESIWTLADLFIDVGELGEAKKLLNRLSQLEASPAILFANARLSAAEGKFGEAVTKLEQIRDSIPTGQKLAYLVLKVNLLLGEWYERLGNPDQQLAAYERVLREEPLSVQARAGKAAALVSLGRIDDALRLYRGLIGDKPLLRLNAVRLMLVRNIGLPPDQVKWEEAKQLLNEAPADIKERPEYRLLAIDLLAVSGQPGEALTEAEKACKEHPKDARFWLARATLTGQNGQRDPVKALAVLDEAEKQIGDTVELRLSRAAREIRKPLDQALPLLQKLEENTDHFSAADKGRLEVGLAGFYQRLGNTKEATRLLSQAASHRPDDISIRVQLFDFALLRGDDAAMAKQIEEVRRIEGDDGVFWRCQTAAQRLLAARKGNLAGLSEARQQLAEAGKRRPSWGKVPALQAEIDELEGDTEQALKDYLKAIDYGERSTQLIRRTVQLLASRRRTDEARQLLQKTIERVPSGLTGDLNRLLVEVSLSDNDSKQHALDMARTAISANSKDFRDFLWLGQVLASLGETKEAESTLRKAVNLKETAPEPRIALILLLTESGRKAEAKAELDQAMRVLPEGVRQQVQAPALEALGQTKDAEAVYLDLLKTRSSNSATKQLAIGFYIRTGQSAKAEPYLRSLVNVDGPDGVWARRTLALTMAMSGDFQKSREALDLLDQNLKSKWSGSEDHRARALVLAIRPSDRRASIQELEDTFSRVKPTPAEEFLLARLYEADRNWARAEEHLISLVTTKQGAASPEALSYYVTALLRHGQMDKAREWLRKLEELEPNGARAVELKARLLKEEKKGDEVGRLLTDYAFKEFAEKKEPIYLRNAAMLLSNLDQPVEAEKLYRRYVSEAEKTQPASILDLASFLSSHNRLGEALDLCEQASEKCTPEMVVSVAVGALRLSEAGAKDRERVRTLLENAVRKKPDSAILLVAKAEFLDACQDYAGSEKTYRDLLERNPRNVAAMNNLAWLLAVHDNNGEEALKLIEKAIEVFGPDSVLLDTRASVYLALGRPEEAIKSLEEALVQSPNGSGYFHLTQAFEKAGKHEAAKDAWLKATKELLLSEKTLHPLERADYQKFSTDLAVDEQKQ